LYGRPIDRGEGIGLNIEHHRRSTVEIENKVPVPHALVVEREPGIGRTAHLKRKTAGYDGRARLSAGKNVELDHILQNPAMNDNLVVRIDF